MVVWHTSFQGEEPLMRDAGFISHYNVHARVSEKRTCVCRVSVCLGSSFRLLGHLPLCVGIVHVMGTDGRAERFKSCGGKIIDLIPERL